MWAEAQVRGQGTMLANEDPILQGRGRGSREASEERGLRCQGHQPPARPGCETECRGQSSLVSRWNLLRGAYPCARWPANIKGGNSGTRWQLGAFP